MITIVEIVFQKQNLTIFEQSMRTVKTMRVTYKCLVENTIFCWLFIKDKVSDFYTLKPVCKSLTLSDFVETNDYFGIVAIQSGTQSWNDQIFIFFYLHINLTVYKVSNVLY